LHGFSEPLGLKWGFWGQNRGRGGWCDIDPLPQRTRSYFWGFLRLCQFWWKSIKKCDRESARRRTDTHTDTDTVTHWQTQTDFIICPMLYAIAMEQIIMYRSLIRGHRSAWWNQFHAALKAYSAAFDEDGPDTPGLRNTPSITEFAARRVDISHTGVGWGRNTKIALISVESQA